MTGVDTEMSRKRFLIPLLAVLAACGGGNDNPPPEPDPTPSRPGQPVPVPAPAPTPVPAPAPAPPSSSGNQNISNPTLTTDTNNEVAPADSLTLVWSDEFNAAKLDPETWFFEFGDGSQYGIPGWGNNELQWYLPDSAQLENGSLVITARQERSNGFNYTSARINTRDRFAFRYGRIEARMKLPGGQGLWPAFWLLPQDSVYGTWAASGEIDIMEAINLGGSGGNEVHGTIHFGGTWPANTFAGRAYTVPANAQTEFHVYAVEWDAAEIRWYVDDTLYASLNNWSSTTAP